MSKKTYEKNRNWCLTANNYKEGALEAIMKLKCVRYGIVGREVGEKGTPHLQGYLILTSRQSMSALSKKLVKCGAQSHLSVARGNSKQNQEYCSKGGDFEEWGKPPKSGQGKRTDIDAVKAAVDEGKSSKEIADEFIGTWLRYHRGIEKLIAWRDEEKSRNFRKLEVTLICGPTGTGKTREALYEEQKDGSWEPIPDTYKTTGSQLKWWNGYTGQKRLVIDEYDNDVRLSTLLGLLDGHQLRLETKGGFTYAQWEQVVITTNLKSLHDNAKEAHKEALMRRITKVVNQWEEEEHRPKVYTQVVFNC